MHYYLLRHTKAFDSIPRCELFLKLWNIRITGKFWNWFRCYLSIHMQCVSINITYSYLLSVLSGVPQGSILGSIFTDSALLQHDLVWNLENHLNFNNRKYDTRHNLHYWFSTSTTLRFPLWFGSFAFYYNLTWNSHLGHIS